MATIPGGAQVVRTANGMYWFVYDLGGGNKVAYHTTDPKVAGSITPLNQIPLIGGNDPGAAIDAGEVNELFSHPPGENFTDWVTKQLNLATGGAAWVNDPEVRNLYVQQLVNPGSMSPEELQYQLKQTNYWK